MVSRRIWTPNRGIREDLKAASIELIGTTVFLLLALGSVQSANLTVVATQGLEVAEFGPHSLDHNVYISASAGVSLLASAWMFYRTTGGVFNPAVSLALRLIGQISTIRFILYVLAQINKLGEGTSMVQGVFIEFFCTAILILSILMLSAEKSRITPFAPIGISMTLFACHMFSVTFTGSSLNPARSFGPSVVAHSFGKEHWIYWVGPLGGSLLSVAFYAWLKHTKYWDINPHQVDTKPGESPEDPVRAAHRDLEKGKAREEREEELRKDSTKEKD